MDKKKTDLFKNVEYFHIVKAKKTLLQLEGEEINNLKLSDLQKKIGSELGEGTYNYVMKYNNDAKIKRAQIRAFIPGKEPVKPESEETGKLLKMIQQLQDKIDNKNSNTDVRDLLELRKQTYEIQLGFYKERIAQLEAENTRLKNQLEDQGGGGSMLESMLPLIQAFLSKKAV